MADFELGSPSERIDLAGTSEFEIGGLRVRPGERAVEVNGDRRELQPRVMQVLVALAQARPNVVSRDTLIERCWDGRVVGDDALNRCILALRHLAREFTPAPFVIETVPRIGHRLVAQGFEPTAVVAPLEAKPGLRIAVVAGIMLAALIGLFAWQYRSGPAGPVSLAVLPFRTLASADPAFSEGIAETLRSQLSAQPDFRVASSASSAQFRRGGTATEAARSLQVDYVVEGNVAADGRRVRIDAALVRAADGRRFWSDSYEGSSADTFSIQQRVGGGIARALGRSLVQVSNSPSFAGGKAEAYNLYLTARGLLRTRSRRIGRTAADLLRDAIKLDPAYAPAWASLAQAVQLDGAAGGHEGLVAAIPLAQGYARHALRLQPDLAEGHRVLGGLLPHGSAEAEAHARRAVELDPNSADSWALLSVCHEDVGEFDRAMADSRRAAELDPQAMIVLYAVVVGETGNRPGAEAIARNALAGDDIARSVLLGRIALRFGDFSEAVRLWSTVVRAHSPRWSEPASNYLNEAKFSLGLPLEALEPVPTPLHGFHRWKVVMKSPPPAAVWRARNRNDIAAQVYRPENLVAAKLMLNAGRTRELAAMLSSPAGLLGIKSGEAVRTDQIGEVPIVALVLRESGRAGEADQLLQEADAAVRAVFRRGRVPFWFEADAAAVWAVQGRTGPALDMLERAVGRGWVHVGGTDLPRLVDEPAFRALRSQPRYQAIRAKIEALVAREREETLRVLKTQS